MMRVGLGSSSGKCRNLGAGSNWRNEYFKASSSSIIEACKDCNQSESPMKKRKSCISSLGKTEYLIAAAVAIVGGREDGHHIPIMRPVVALHHQLVSPEMLLMIFSSNPACKSHIDSYRVTKVSPFEWLKVSDMS